MVYYCVFAFQTHIQNSTLAGGIAVGAISQLVVQPWAALLIGVVGSLISVIGFRYILVCAAVFVYLIPKGLPYLCTIRGSTRG